MVDEEAKDKCEDKKNEKMLTTLSLSRLSRFPPPPLVVYKIIVFAEVDEDWKSATIERTEEEEEEKRKTDQLELLLRCCLNGNKSTSLNHVCSTLPPSNFLFCFRII